VDRDSEGVAADLNGATHNCKAGGELAKPRSSLNTGGKVLLVALLYLPLAPRLAWVSAELLLRTRESMSRLTSLDREGLRIREAGDLTFRGYGFIRRTMTQLSDETSRPLIYRTGEFHSLASVLGEYRPILNERILIGIESLADLTKTVSFAPIDLLDNQDWLFLVPSEVDILESLHLRWTAGATVAETPAFPPTIEFVIYPWAGESPRRVEVQILHSSENHHIQLNPVIMIRQAHREHDARIRVTASLHSLFQVVEINLEGRRSTRAGMRIIRQEASCVALASEDYLANLKL